jgi:hypothetical protein
MEGRSFRCSFPVVLELLFCPLPHVAPEHTGLFGEARDCAELGRMTEGDSGEVSG